MIFLCSQCEEVLKGQPGMVGICPSCGLVLEAPMEEAPILAEVVSGVAVPLKYMELVL